MKTFITLVMLLTSFMNVLLFCSKWIDTDFSTAWNTFEDFVGKCLDTEEV